jgi:hypothetical protein
MEEARQHTALRALCRLSIILWASSAAGLLALVLAKNVAVLGSIVVPTMFLAVLSRFGDYTASFVVWREANQPTAIIMAVYGVIWLLFSALFFVFVVLRQFGVTP